jgi:hypothetical protein
MEYVQYIAYDVLTEIMAMPSQNMALGLLLQLLASRVGSLLTALKNNSCIFY